jgi:hypothetical protein
MRSALLAAVAIISFSWSASAQEAVGRTAVVVETVNGTLLQTTRRLAVKDDVHLDETISTMPKSASQLVFFDGTTMGIGENSNVVLSKFVYDPRPSAAQFAVNYIKGGFRFITGAFSKESYDVETPTATIGVRGTDFDTWVDPTGTNIRVHSGTVLLGDKSGNMHPVNAGETGTIDRGGKFSQSETFNSPMFASLDSMQQKLAEALRNDGVPSLGIPHAYAFRGIGGFSPSGSNLDRESDGRDSSGVGGQVNEIVNGVYIPLGANSDVGSRGGGGGQSNQSANGVELPLGENSARVQSNQTANAVELPLGENVNFVSPTTLGD